MPIIHLRRHSFVSPDDPQADRLSPFGRAMALTIGDFYSKTKFTHLAHGLKGCTQTTLDLFAHGANGRDMSEPFLQTERRAEWQAANRTSAFIDYDSTLVRQEAERMRQELDRYMRRVGSEATILAVGQAYLLETLVFGTTGHKTAMPFRECEGAVLQYENGEFGLSVGLRIPFDDLRTWFLREHLRVFRRDYERLRRLNEHIDLLNRLRSSDNKPQTKIAKPRRAGKPHGPANSS